MKESEYILVSNLRSIENAQACLRTILPSEQFRLDDDDLRYVKSKLAQWNIELYDALSGKVIVDEKQD